MLCPPHRPGRRCGPRPRASSSSARSLRELLVGQEAGRFSGLTQPAGPEQEGKPWGLSARISPFLRFTTDECWGLAHFRPPGAEEAPL